MNMQTTISTADKFQLNTKSLLVIVLTVALAAMFAAGGFDALAATGGFQDEFSGMWGEIKTLANGAPGKILIMLMVLGVVIFSTVKPNLLGFAGCVISILVLANAGDLIDNSLTASILDVANAALSSAVK